MGEFHTLLVDRRLCPTCIIAVMDTKKLITLSQTHKLTLNQVLQRLEQKPIVDAILLIGSTGAASLTLDSDYDILLIVNEMPVKLFSLLTTIDGHIGDIYFVAASEVDELKILNEAIDTSELTGKLLGWVETGTIVVDKSGRLKKLKEKSQSSDILRIAENQIYSTWFALNYNYKQNQRYFRSQKPAYLTALTLRLSWGIFECLLGYFVLRGMEWRGEKDAIGWLQTHAPTYLELVQACLSENNIHRKFPLYESVLKETIPENLGIWKENIVGVTLHQPYSEQAVKTALRFWNNLVGV
jgi:hypothetical protein